MTTKTKPATKRRTNQQISFQDRDLYDYFIAPRTAAGESVHQVARLYLRELFPLLRHAILATPVTLSEALVIVAATEDAEGPADALPIKVDRWLGSNPKTKLAAGVDRLAFRERLIQLSPWQLFALEDAARCYRIAREIDNGALLIGEFFKVEG